MHIRCEHITAKLQFKLDEKIGVNATMVASRASSYDSINRLNKILLT
jgi:hypothetical protein